MAAKKRQVCFRIEESLVKEMEHISAQTGVPVSTQIEMRLKGYSITRNTEKRGNAAEVLRWYQNLEKDEEFADNVDAAVEKMRELRLH
jgi:antitoxin component of RelBE/YafQ-DinJ toxin-antitoxin module